MVDFDIFNDDQDEGGRWVLYWWAYGTNPQLINGLGYARELFATRAELDARLKELSQTAFKGQYNDNQN